MQQLKIEHCTKDDADILSDLLESHGALSVTMTDQYDDPILEPEPGTVPLWPHIVIQALYESSEDMHALIQTIMTQYPNASCSSEALPPQDWERTCLTDFQPQRFGNHLWVCPSWHTPPDPHAINLTLDPGLAFGTGSHPTTSLCLTWLEQATLHHKTLIDYGCGSGILSIAALKLGATHVYAVDIDPQALIATESNAHINHITAQSLTMGYPDSLHCTVDVIIANILLTPLLTLKESFHHLLQPKGLLALSGLLANQTHQLIEHYQDLFTLITSEREGDWALLVLEKITDAASHKLN